MLLIAPTNHELLESSTIAGYEMKAIGQPVDKIFHLLLSDLLKKVLKNSFKSSLAQGGGKEWYGDDRQKPGRHAYDKEGTEEGTAIKPILVKENESSGEMVLFA